MITDLTNSMVDDFTNILRKMVVGVLEKRPQGQRESVSDFVIKNYVMGEKIWELTPESD